MIHVSVKDWYRTRTFTFAQDRVVVGNSDRADLVLDREGVAPRHVQLSLRDGAIYIDDLRNGTRGTTPIEPDAIVRIAGIDLRIAVVSLEPEAIGDAAEQRLVDEIRARPDDPSPRTVYADYLDERGHAARAEFLRVQIAAGAAARADDPTFKAAAARLAELAPEVGLGWRALVAMTFVEKCPTKRRHPAALLELKCPMRWDQLTPTADPGVRSCGACQQRVTYCTSVSQAHIVAERGGCVAVDLREARAHGDLDPPIMVGRPSPPFSRYGTREGDEPSPPVVRAPSRIG